jgi:parvulin-like peptidyl-prolyl isomerase
MITGLLAASLAGQSVGQGGAKDEAVRVDGVAAYVNAHVITFSDVLGASRALQQRIAQRQGGEDVNALYQKALEDLINRKLILDAYSDQKQIRIPDEMIEERVQNVIREMFQNDRMAFLGALAAEGQTETAWREQIREQIVVGAMRNFRVDSQVRVSPLIVRERYDQTLSQQETPPAVTFRMIVIGIGQDETARAAQKEKLAAVLAALGEGMEFDEVARRYSEDALAAGGGLRDGVEPDMLRAELRDLIMQADIGVVKGPVEIGPHYALVKVVERREAARRSFEDAYATIEREVRMELEQRLYDEWIAQLRRDSFVRVLNEKPL